MSKIAVVYWSGTGNTESMAAMVAAGAKEAGAEAVLLTAAEFGPDQMDGYDAIAFHVLRLRGQTAGEEDRPVRFLWLG